MSGNFWLSLPRPIVALAPMEGVTDEPFRRICREHGADVVYTEFVSADAIVHRAPTVMRKLRFHESERPIVAQIFGRRPESFAIAARTLTELGFDGIDINLGCPARKVIGSGSGVALLREPATIRTLLEATLSATTLPVSIKVRASIRKERPSIAPHDPTRVTALDVVQALSDLPIAAIMVHGRTAEANDDDQVDTEMIAAVKRESPAVVLGNGGIRTVADAATMIAATNVDGVGVARGAWGHPWVFHELRAALRHESIPVIDPRQVILKHAELVVADSGERGLLDFRKHFAHYINGFPGAAGLRKQAVTVSTLDEVRRITEAMPNT